MKMSRMASGLLLGAALVFAAVGSAVAEVPVEGNLDSFLGEPTLDIQPNVHGGDRFPNIVVAMDGSVLAFWSGVKLRRSEDGGKTWGPDILVAKGFMGGGVTVNESNGEIFAFVEKNHPPSPLTIHSSKDHGKTWAKVDAVVKPDKNGHLMSMHMNEHGITLRHGKHKGRMLRPARWYGKGNGHSEWHTHYTSAIYSDDGGKTWNASDPFPAFGTGEATLAELSDGRVYYNSRRHWAPEGVNPLRRWTAISEDGGQTWKDLSICEVLPDGPQNTNYGCMAGLVRLPIKGRDILLYSNCDSPDGRRRGTVWTSFDGGKTWPLKRLVREAGFGYSSMTAGRPDTASEGWVYLNFEGDGSEVARFNLSWLLGGEKTGDGEVPKWIRDEVFPRIQARSASE